MDSGKILVLVGMHRSGTSLTAGWLNACNLSMGDNLLKGTFANKKGHFEDLDFLKIHESILTDNGLDYLVNENDQISVSETHRQKIKQLVTTKNKKHNQWGWKEPRTCLFLDIYNELIPDAKYMIVYRPYLEVVDSLYRRIDKFQKSKTPIQKLYNKIFKVHKVFNPDDLVVPFLASWIKYNQAILEFIDKVPSSNYMLFESQQLISENAKIFEILNNKWTFEIDNYDIKSHFDSNLFSKKINNKYNFPAKLEQQAKEIEQQLAAKIKLEV